MTFSPPPPARRDVIVDPSPAWRPRSFPGGVGLAVAAAAEVKARGVERVDVTGSPEHPCCSNCPSRQPWAESANRHPPRTLCPCPQSHGRWSFALPAGATGLVGRNTPPPLSAIGWRVLRHSFLNNGRGRRGHDGMVTCAFPASKTPDPHRQLLAPSRLPSAFIRLGSFTCKRRGRDPEQRPAVLQH